MVVGQRQLRLMHACSTGGPLFAAPGRVVTSLSLDPRPACEVVAEVKETPSWCTAAPKYISQERCRGRPESPPIPGVLALPSNVLRVRPPSTVA